MSQHTQVYLIPEAKVLTSLEFESPGLEFESPGFESQLCPFSHMTLGKSLFSLGLFFLIKINDFPIIPQMGKYTENA